jgi:thiol:disulfide interchange protein
MRVTAVCIGILVAVLLNLSGTAVAGEANAPAWQAWSPRVFDEARRESRLVLLEVAAEWCQTCKKMEQVSFRDPRVIETIGKHYLAVRADVDRVADIKQRYGEYGVPAVVILDAAGNEIIRRRGYLEPEWLYWMLVAAADDPRPEAHR